MRILPLLWLLLVSASVQATPITTVLNSSSVSINGLGRYNPASGQVSVSYATSASATMGVPFVENLSGSNLRQAGRARSPA